MESTPSAQNVGREFVRQYYTMLNEAPQFLHRFYSHNSSFVHGGLERAGEESSPAIGQAEIFKKIVSLNFRDCHAKICQVDSQSSVEGTVVIQVVGELSNDGQPMRRFMQTFVLAPQSPKKYYVHNDIFRYQDEVFHDYVDENSALHGGVSATNEDSGDYVEDDLHQQQPRAAAAEAAVENSYAKPEVAAAVYHEQQQQHHLSNGDVYPRESGSDVSQQQLGVTPTSVIEAATAAVEPAEAAAAVNNHGVGDGLELAAAEPAAVNESTAAAAAKPDVAAAAVSSAGEPAAAAVTATAAVPEPQAAPQQPAAPAQKPTWAAMASRNTAAPAAPAGAAVKPQATIRPELKSEQQQQLQRGTAAAAAPNGALPQRPPRGQQQQQNEAAAGSSRAAAAVDDSAAVDEAGEDINRAAAVGRGQQQQLPQVYPDSQQVFVGNVPHFITDEELKEYLEQYGPVADIRINRKANTNIPNYGFVAFESAETVQKILGSMPLPKLHNKHRINIEEKKPREELSRPRSSGPRPPMGLGPAAAGGPRAQVGMGSATGGPRAPAAARGGGRGAGYSNGGGARNYTKSISSDDGRGPPAPHQSQR